ncbi:MAG: hypothetical protein IT423_19410 [Pirellulaceae bacterium]|nr:hypothetical protein [Pirellulaceae bacterium]
MNVQDFLQHHHLTRNPFAEEDAQTDAVFKQHCIDSTFHPAWDKVFGSPTDPSTSIVFGPKGSGKTAMRLQLDKHIRAHNRANADSRVFVIHYDDFNGYIGHMQSRLGGWSQRKPEKVLQQFGIQDHMDAILIQGVTALVDQILQTTGSATGPDEAVRQDAVDRLDGNQRGDLLLLATSYDQSTLGNTSMRWEQLRSRLRISKWKSTIDWSISWIGSIAAALGSAYLFFTGSLSLTYAAIAFVVVSLAVSAKYLWRLCHCYFRARQMSRNCRVRRQSISEQARLMLKQPWSTWASEPMPVDRVSASRYELLEKFQHILRTLGFPGILVLVDRVDEPQMVNGQAERIRLLVWPLLDNKLLKHPGVGFKLLLPQELQYFVDRETREFHERARLDKQNVIAGFDWTGEALYDLVCARMKACAQPGTAPQPGELFDPAIDTQRLINAMRDLRVPRNLFRFLYRVVSEHCKKYTSSEPQYRIAVSTFESVLALSQEEFRRQA